MNKLKILLMGMAAVAGEGGRSLDRAFSVASSCNFVSQFGVFLKAPATGSNSAP